MSITIDEPPTRQYRGLAACSPEKRREIARKGGQRAQELGTAHKWTSEEAARAGNKSAEVRKQKRKRGGQ